MKTNVIILLSTLVFFIGCSSSSVQTPIYHSVECNESVYSLKSGKCLEDEEFIEYLEPYKVIFIGDHHSSKKQHEHSANIIRELSKKGYKIHLANEWFTPNDNELLKEYASKQINDGNFTEKFGWKEKKNFDFELFVPLYHSVRDTNGELYGINISKKERKRISDVNITGMSEQEKLFFDSLDLNVSAHKMLLSPFFSHCHKPKNGESNEECIIRMYRVQVAWDAKMGRESANLAKEVLKSDKDKLIVFIGAMHLSHGLGANLRFARESKLPFVTMLPQYYDHNLIEHSKADFIYLYQREKKDEEIENKLIKNLKESNKKEK